MKVRIKPSLTASEKKVLRDLCDREVRERVDRTNTYCDALLLLSLARYLDYGKEQLIDFYHKMRKDYFDYIDRYDVDAEDAGWLLLQRCKTELDIDIEELEKQDIIERNDFVGNRKRV